MTKFQNERVQFLGEHGYFLVPAFLEPAELVTLRRACDMALDRARAQSTTRGHTTPSINLFADPDCFANEPGALVRLTEFVSSARVCALLRGLAHPGEDDTPRIEKTDYYTSKRNTIGTATCIETANSSSTRSSASRRSSRRRPPYTSASR